MIPYRRRALVQAAAVLGFVSAIWADVAVPPGYRVVDMSNQPPFVGGFSQYCRINNHGDVVYEWWSNGLDPSGIEIMLYSDGEVRRITNNTISDRVPYINDHGDIAWSSETGPNGELEVWTLRDGAKTRVSVPIVRGVLGRCWTRGINNDGCVLWNQVVGEPCDEAVSELWLYDGSRSSQITSVGQWNQGASLNNRGEVAWARYDFCASPWTSQIWLYSGGQSRRISPDDHLWPQVGEIADDGTVVWMYYQSELVPYAIGIYRDEVASQLVPWGMIPRISDSGIISVTSHHADGHTSQVWLNDGSGFGQLTFDPFHNFMGVVNNRREVAWTSELGDYQVHALVRLPGGDMNCDGAVSLADIPPFVFALTDAARYGAEYPACDRMLADLNSDGAVTVSDIGPFVKLQLP